MLPIEKAFPADAEEILALQKLCYVSEAKIYNDYNIPPMTQTLYDINREFLTHSFLKIVSDGRIIGSVRTRARNGICTIYKLIVHPDFQNQGIGKRLISAAEEHNPDCERFEIFTGHRSARNIHIYQSMGYVITKAEKISDAVQYVYLSKNNG